MVPDDSANAPITKLMSLAEHEFVMSCERLAGEGDAVTKREATISVGQGAVVIRYEPLPGVRLGGLLELPRANVTLTYAGVSSEDQEKFTSQFEMTFQRGGG